MLSSTFLTLAATAILGTNAITLEKREEPRVVEYPIQRKQTTPSLLRRRDGTLTVALDNEETLYFMNATIGTPAQSFRLHLDTGSSDLWVNVKNSDLCSNSRSQCGISGTYDANSSSTYRYLNNDFNITYVDGSGSSGDYATDTVSFGGVTIDNQQFGIGYKSTSEEGILGIGYPINEVAVAYNGGQPYANVPQSLLNNGDIATNAYSLWLNDLDASTGSILFGGVNIDKYTGSLETLPIVKEQGVYAEFIIALTGIGRNGQSGSLGNDLAIPALLDSGSSLMYLPNDQCQKIYDAVGAQYDSSQQVAFVDCTLANSDDTIDFTFSSPTIKVAMNELVIVAGIDRGQEICILGIAPAGSSTPVLGDTFLRSAYVVYDLTNNEISLAQTNFNSTSDNIMEITNSTGIPSATNVQGAVTSVAVSSGGARIDNDFTSSLHAGASPTLPPSAKYAVGGTIGGAIALWGLI